MRISDIIHINAPAEVVWTVTIDIERWPEWTPTITSVTRLDSGPLKPGSVARVTQPMQPVSEWVVTEITPGRVFSWETRRRGIHMSATHQIFPENGTTRNVLHVDVKGTLAVLFRPLLRFTIRRALAEENRGLKQRCES
jgi:uncharacterized membrane protein